MTLKAWLRVENGLLLCLGHADGSEEWRIMAREDAVAMFGNTFVQ